MWSLRAALSFQGLITLSRRSISHYLHAGNLLLRGVIAQLVAFGLCEDAEECRIAVRHPMAEGKTADEDGYTGEDGIEEIEGPDRADAYEVKERTFHAQVGEWFMQALEDSICAFLLMWSVWHSSLVEARVEGGWKGRYTPQSQL